MEVTKLKEQHNTLCMNLQASVEDILLSIFGFRWKVELLSGLGSARVILKCYNEDTVKYGAEITYVLSTDELNLVVDWNQVPAIISIDNHFTAHEFIMKLGMYLNATSSHEILKNKMKEYVIENDKILLEIVKEAEELEATD